MDNQVVSSTVKDYIERLTSRIIEKSGNQDDRYHLGKMIFQSLSDDPDSILQIDAATEETETNGSALKRSIKCALAFQRLGLKKGDVMILMGPNNIHQCISLYAGLYQGLAVCGIDRFLITNELKNTFESVKPKIIFCIQEKSTAVKEALDKINLKSYIVTYDNNHDNFWNFHDLLSSSVEENDILNYKPLDLAPDTTAFLVATSGSTGLPKCTICTHKAFAIGAYYWFPGINQFPKPMKNLLISPIQWLTAISAYVMSAILRYTKLQTSAVTTREHIYRIINTYRPEYTIMSPTFMAMLVNPAERHKCDFSSFKTVILGGSAVSQHLLQDMRDNVTPAAQVFSIYGLSEVAGACTTPALEPRGTLGTPTDSIEAKLVDASTGEEVKQANTPGELWVKGPTLFKGYYNNEAATKASFTQDGWFKTGDILYKDENGYLFFVERLKLLLKFRNNQISPGEIEEVIRTHPGVVDVAVSGIPHKEDGDLPVAFVVKRPGENISSEDLQKLVKGSLTDSKQLRGGVVFIDEIPLTAGGKVNILKVRQMAEKLSA